MLYYMTKPVTLSEEAFRTLRSLKAEGESDSDVVLRLAAREEKDPRLLLRVGLEPVGESWDEVARELEEMAKADRRDFAEAG